MTARQERRAHPRRRAKEQVTVEVLASDEVPDLVNREIVCSTQDLSVGGLRFRSDTPIPVGALIKLGIETRQPKRRFEMQGRVVWMVLDGDDGQHAVGVHFSDVGRQNLNAWRHMLEKRGALGS